MSTTPATPAKNPAINDSMAGSKAQKYINGLYLAVQAATTDYNSHKSNLQKYVTQQTDYTVKYDHANALYTRLHSNLKDAETAQKDINKVLAFFNKQQSEVLTMVNNAKDMSTHAFESLAFLVQQGIGRVDAINATINVDNETFTESKTSQNPPLPNTPVPWISNVTDAVGKAQASGSVAMNAGKEAVEAAFNAYITNQTIYSRTTSYLASFASFHKQLKTLQDRLVKESSLAEHQAKLLKAQLKIINARVTSLDTLVDKKKIALDQANKKYNAAQQGASYAAS